MTMEKMPTIPRPITLEAATPSPGSGRRPQNLSPEFEAIINYLAKNFGKADAAANLKPSALPAK